jgi:NAD(P)-dependent dehydrogenase (short-subunit alcohol dehydrogenase family)
VTVDVSKRKAVVIGGTSGIGLATTNELAARGATVIAVSRDPSKAGDLPGSVTTMTCDVLDRDGLAALFSSCAPFDILVTSATGGRRAIGPFLAMDMDAFELSFRKVWGYANVLRYGTEHLSDDGTIVLITGTPAQRTIPGMVAIGAAGAAIESLARSVAREIAPRRLNVVSPGVIDTPMNPLQGAERAASFARSTGRNLIPRPGTAEEVVQAILFAIENDFVTGTTVDVDGGWHA